MRLLGGSDCPESRLGTIAQAQHGTFSRKQAHGAGVSASMIARRLQSGVWVKIHPGVFRIGGAPTSWHQDLIAACLWAGDDAVVSHLTAARLHSLEGIPGRKRGEPIELTVPMKRKLIAPGFVVHRSRTLERADRTTVEQIPVTSLARTLVAVAPRLDERRLARALDSGLARHPSMAVRMIRREVRRLKERGRAGPCALARLLEMRDPDALPLDSALERRFRAALARSGLPKPVEHYDVVENGRHLAQLDFAYPSARVGIQLNGAGVHRRYDVWERDQEQWSDLAAAGWRIVQVTWAQLEASEAAVIDRIARALMRR
jgi:hypothetical protein